MADDESRAARQKALAEKKRRLEEIKARRRQPSAAASASAGGAASSSNADGASSGAGLDSYIDDLLKTSTPGLTLAPAPPTPTAEAAGAAAGAGPAEVGKAGGEEKQSTESNTAASEPSAASAPSAAPVAAPVKPTVETFEIAVQCEEDDFPPPSLVDEDEPPEDDDKSREGSDAENENAAEDNNPLQASTSYDSHADQRRFSKATMTSAEPLNAEEKSKVLSSPPFAHFLSTASKRVERLLGAGEENMYGILNGSGWGSSSGESKAGAGADFSVDYADEDDDYSDDDEADGGAAAGATAGRKKRRSKKKKGGTEEAYQSGGYFTARATYEFPKFTAGRSVTDIEWCPGHKEWVLASYNSVSGVRGADGEGGGVVAAVSGMPSHNPSTRHLSPHDPSSSFLQPSSAYNNFTSAIPNEGIVAIYNLSMPQRPEHVFCAGCPILHAQFHPTEHPKLIVGGGSSGQVLVWDARTGRYPVQRSGANAQGGKGGGAMHDCELVGMRVLGGAAAGADGGAAGGISSSKLVTASSDGKVNYWSASNLREPIENVKVDANLSCMEVLNGGAGGGDEEGVLCGDEMGGLHAVLAGTGRDGSSATKKVVRTLHPGAVVGAGVEGGAAGTDEDADGAEEPSEGHYGMVTSVAARSGTSHLHSPRSGNKETTTTSTSKGFLRGAGGLVVTTGVDWSTKLWAPAYSTTGPLMSFLSNSYDYMCDVQWSPVHPSIFATASSNGTLNIWNLATTLDQPISGTEGIPIHGGSSSGSSGDATTTSRPGLNRLQWSSDGRRMAVASGDKLHVLGVGEEVWKSKGDEEGRVMHNLVSRGLIQE